MKVLAAVAAVLLLLSGCAVDGHGGPKTACAPVGSDWTCSAWQVDRASVEVNGAWVTTPGLRVRFSRLDSVPMISFSSSCNVFSSRIARQTASSIDLALPVQGTTALCDGTAGDQDAEAIYLLRAPLQLCYAGSKVELSNAHGLIELSR